MQNRETQTEYIEIQTKKYIKNDRIKTYLYIT